jgi:hypothetical protein
MQRCEAAYGKGNCREDGGVALPKCDENPDWGDAGATCAKPTYSRASVTGLSDRQCDSGKQIDAGLCYTPCKDGYKIYQLSCRQQCTGSTPVECGAYFVEMHVSACAPSKEACSRLVEPLKRCPAT